MIKLLRRLFAFLKSRTKPKLIAKPQGLGEPGSPGVWPVRPFSGFPPVITDGFGRPGPKGKRNGRGHLGVDIMFRRKVSGDFSLPEYTRHYFAPTDKVVAQNVAPGYVWRADYDKNHGWYVKIDHGGSHLSVFRHLSECVVKQGDTVVAGQALGYVGHAPSAGKNGVNHLHFEIWDTSRPGRKASRASMAVDPWKWLKHWEKK